MHTPKMPLLSSGPKVRNQSFQATGLFEYNRFHFIARNSWYALQQLRTKKRDRVRKLSILKCHLSGGIGTLDMVSLWGFQVKSANSFRHGHKRWCLFDENRVSNMDKTAETHNISHDTHGLLKRSFSYLRFCLFGIPLVHAYTMIRVEWELVWNCQGRRVLGSRQPIFHVQQLHATTLYY